MSALGARVTQQDIANRVGVSRATVSAAISGARYVNPALKARILAVIEELHYVPDSVARSMKTRRTMTIGLVIPNILSPFHAPVVRAVEDIAGQCGFSTIVYDTDEQPERMASALRNLQQRRVDGIILAPCGDCTDILSDYVTRTSTPIVQVDRYVEGLDMDAVTSDNEGGSYDAIKHLLDTGHRRVAIITVSLNLVPGRERLNGYRRALAEHGTPIDDSLIIVGGRGEADGHHGAERLLALPGGQRPDALFACSHLITVGALKKLREESLHVPDDVAVIGFDDLPWSSLFDPPLTVVNQPAYDMGAKAAEILMMRLSGEPVEGVQRVVLGTQLVHRSSCCRPASNPRSAQFSGPVLK